MGIEGIPLQIGMMMTVFLAAYGIANVVLSPLAIIFGPRKAMMLRGFDLTIALMRLAVATSFALIIICRILLASERDFIIHCKAYLLKTGSRSRNAAEQTRRGSSASQSLPPLRCLFTVDRHPRAGAPTFYAPNFG